MLVELPEDSGRRLLLEDTIDCTTAAGHGGIDGTGGEQAVLDVGNGGVLRKDAILEIVFYDLLPFVDGALDALEQIVLWPTGSDALIGFARADKIVGLDEQ